MEATDVSDLGSDLVAESRRADVMTRRDELGVGSWDLTVLLATVFLAIVIPIEVVFDTLDARWLMVVSALISVLLTVDIRRRLAEDRSEYLRGWFVVDLLAAIPFDLLAEAPGIEASSAAEVIRFLSLLRVLRIARIFVLAREWRLRTSLNPALLRLACKALPA